LSRSFFPTPISLTDPSFLHFQRPDFIFFFSDFLFSRWPWFGAWAFSFPDGPQHLYIRNIAHIPLISLDIQVIQGAPNLSLGFLAHMQVALRGLDRGMA